MITFFTIPKPFSRKTVSQSNITDIQTLAIQSWARLFGLNQIILFGDGENIGWFADEYGFLHFDNVAKNKFGTPYLNYIFDWANRASKNDIICYINSDIILCEDFMKSISGALGIYRLQKDPDQKFLITGSHYDTDYNFVQKCENKGWKSGFDNLFAKQVRTFGDFHRNGIDYFVYRKGMFSAIPQFVIGRGTWDNYLIYCAQNRDHAPVIDATNCITAVHMKYEYSDISKDIFGQFKGIESYQNYVLAQDWRNICTIDDVNYVLDCKGGYSLQVPAHTFKILKDIKRAFVWKMRTYRAQ